MFIIFLRVIHLKTFIRIFYTVIVSYLSGIYSFIHFFISLFNLFIYFIYYLIYLITYIVYRTEQSN